MKHYIFPLFILGSLLTQLTSCSKLEEQPYSSIYTSNFYKTASDAQAALVSAFSPVADMHAGPATIIISDFSADQAYPRPVVGRNTYTLFNYDPNYTSQKSFSRYNESAQQVWQSCYAGIENANLVIENVPNTNMDSLRRNEIIGEALFLRAYYYWTLTKNFKDVIIKTKASSTLEEAYQGKSPKADVYKQIYADLDRAINLLPNYTPALTKGWASKQTAIALFAKAALYNEEWARALDKAQQVIVSGRYTLMLEVKDLYDVTKEDAARQEIMWAFESVSTSPGRGSQVTSLHGPKNSESPAYGPQSFGSIFIYPSFFASFNPSDKRRQLLDTNYLNTQGRTVNQKDITPITPFGILVKKYQSPKPLAPGGTDSNIPILRLADIYLIAAEAEARLNGPTTLAYSYVLPVRQRAGLGNIAAGLSKDQFIDAVLQERSWEFFAEGDRWYDLTRTGKFLTVIPLAVNDVFPIRTPLPKHRYFPIPLDEINANPGLEQNPDWK
ncbi:MAG: RagB/SusD family nutrient uptake outer membrane protein [Chitinophagaceae bacterium]